jgi:putative two-component system response regulator
MDGNYQSTVLVVDDIEANISVLVETLSDICDISVALNGFAAIELAQELKPDLILLDVMMPGMSGFDVCKKLKADPATQEIPIIFLTGVTEVTNKAYGFEIGAVDYVTKPFEAQDVLVRVKTHLSLVQARKELKNHNDILEDKVKERTRELESMREAIISSMATVAEYRDPETGGHILRTKSYVLALAKQLQIHSECPDRLDNKSIELLTLSAPLHDIGKVGTPDNILLKPGKLSPDEFEIMKKHTIIGHDTLLRTEKMLGKNSFLQFAKEIAYSHHEKWDGSGYPRGLAGNDIPISGRIMAVADVYDALICKRVYKLPFTHSRAVEIMTKDSGTHFDPLLIDVFLEIQNEIRQIALKFADFDEERASLKDPLITS